MVTEGQFRDAFYVKTELCTVLRTATDRVLVRVDGPHMITVRIENSDKGRYQDNTVCGNFMIRWGPHEWPEAIPENDAPRITDDRLLRPVARAILAQIEREDTSCESVAQAAAALIGSEVKLTGRKVGVIARDGLGLTTQKAGAKGRYCIVVTQEDRERLVRTYGEVTDVA